jgi:integrase
MGRGRGVRVTLQYIHTFTDRYGHVRRYFRRPGSPRVTLPGKPGSPEFMAVYNQALADRPNGPQTKVTRPELGTVASAVSLYLGSAVFNALAAETIRTRRNILERFREAHGSKRVAKLEPKHIQQMVDAKAGTPSAARNFLNTLSSWLKWCAREGIIRRSPVVDIERTPIKTEGYKPWTNEMVGRYRARWPLGTRQRLALELLVGTGQARVDVVKLGRQHVQDRLLVFRRQKTGVPVEIPILRELQEAIDAMPYSANLTFLTTAQGKAFGEASFGVTFRKWCNQGGIPVGYSAHGVRKYAATDRANQGATTHELMAWFGWLTVREAERYTRAAARRQLALRMAERLSR